MDKIKDVDYLFATARLRALERDMLEARDIEKMIEAATLEESYKIANDISLHSRLECGEYEVAIGEMLRDTYMLIRGLTNASPLFDIFCYKYDGHNLKVLIKALSMGVDPLPVMSGLGTVLPETLAAAFAERKLADLPERIMDAAYRAADSLAKTGDPQNVDILLDRAVLESMLNAAQETHFDFLIHLVRTQVDLENLRTTVRLKRMGKDIGLLKKLLVDGGTIELSRLYGAFGPDGLDALRDALFITDYFGYFAPLFEGIGSPKKALTAFERGVDNYMIRMLRSTKLVAFGLEPVISYLLAKEGEAKQIRIILASKQAGVPRDKINERVRETYA